MHEVHPCPVVFVHPAPLLAAFRAIVPVGAVPVEHELGVVHRAEIVVSVAAFQYGYLQRVLLPVPYCFLQSAQDFCPQPVFEDDRMFLMSSWE